jgi:hypothetical protein
MKVFRDLYLTGSPDQIRATVAEIERSLSDRWRRDLESERRLKEGAINGRDAYCFARTARASEPAAALFLMEQDDGSLSVTNIIPREVGELSYDQYNAVIKEFHDRFAQPAAKKTGAVVALTADEKGIDSWLSTHAAKTLQSFSSLANKSTGSGHPLDRERWFAFLLAAHDERSELDCTTLRRWLVESERWSELAAMDLAVEYEFGRELLAFADAHRTNE